MKFAEKTKVPVERSRIEIEKILSRYKATSFAYGSRPDKAVVQFEMNNRRIRFLVPMPDKTSREVLYIRNKRRTSTQVEDFIAQLQRQKWRALTLAIKAKLEAVESGISTFEEEFMANIVMPNQQTVGEWMSPQLDQAYKNNTMPPLMIGMK